MTYHQAATTYVTALRSYLYEPEFAVQLVQLLQLDVVDVSQFLVACRRLSSCKEVTVTRQGEHDEYVSRMVVFEVPDGSASVPDPTALGVGQIVTNLPGDPMAPALPIGAMAPALPIGAMAPALPIGAMAPALSGGPMAPALSGGPMIDPSIPGANMSPAQIQSLLALQGGATKPKHSGKAGKAAKKKSDTRTMKSAS